MLVFLPDSVFHLKFILFLTALNTFTRVRNVHMDQLTAPDKLKVHNKKQKNGMIQAEYIGIIIVELP